MSLFSGSQDSISQKNGTRSTSVDSTHSSAVVSGHSRVVSQPTEGFQVHATSKDRSRDQTLSTSTTQHSKTAISQENVDSVKRSRAQDRNSVLVSKGVDVEFTSAPKSRMLDSSRNETSRSPDRTASVPPGIKERSEVQNLRTRDKILPGEVSRQFGISQPSRVQEVSPAEPRDVLRHRDVTKHYESDSSDSKKSAPTTSVGPTNVLPRRTDVTARDRNISVEFVPVSSKNDTPEEPRSRLDSQKSTSVTSRSENDFRREVAQERVRDERHSDNERRTFSLSSYSSRSEKEAKSEAKVTVLEDVKGSEAIGESEMMRQLLAMAGEGNADNAIIKSTTQSEISRLKEIEKIDKRVEVHAEEEIDNNKQRPILTLTAGKGSPISTFVLTSSRESLESSSDKRQTVEQVSSKPEHITQAQLHRLSTEFDASAHSPLHIDADKMAEMDAQHFEEKQMGEAVSKVLKLKRGKSEDIPIHLGSIDDSNFNLRKKPDITLPEYESLSDSEIKIDPNRRGRKTLLGDRPKQASEDLSDLPELTDLGAIGGGGLDDIPVLWPPTTEGTESKYISVEDLTKVGLGVRITAIGQKHSNNNIRRKRQKAGDGPLSPGYDSGPNSPPSEGAFDQLSSECTSLADSEDDYHRDHYEDQDYMTEDRSYSSFDSGDEYMDYMEDVIMEDISMEHEVVEHLSPYRIKEEGLATVMEEQEEVDEYYLEEKIEEEEEEEEEDEEEEEELDDSEEETEPEEDDRVNVLATIQEQTSEETQESSDYIPGYGGRYGASRRDEQRHRRDENTEDASASDEMSDMSSDQTFESLSSALNRDHITPVAATLEREITSKMYTRPPLAIDLTSNIKHENSGILDSPRTPPKDSRAYERPKITSPNKRIDISSPRTSPISPNVFSPPLTPKSWSTKRTFPETMFPMEHSTQVEEEVETQVGGEEKTKFRSVFTGMGSSFEDFASIRWPETITENPLHPADRGYKDSLHVETRSSISPEDSTSASESTVITCGHLVSTSCQTQVMVERKTQTTPPPVYIPTHPLSKILIDAAVGPGVDSPGSNSSSPSKSVHTASIGVGTSPEMSPTSSTHSTDTDFSAIGLRRPLGFDDSKHAITSSNASSSGSSSPEPTGAAKRNPRPARRDTGSQDKTQDALASLKHAGQFTGKDYLKVRIQR